MSSKFMICFTCVVMIGLIYPQVGQTTQDESTIKEAVKPAIEAGVEYLRQQQTNQGTWAFQGSSALDSPQVVGATALCGIALMECNVPTSDKQVQAAYRVVKAAANDARFNYTYSVCLSMLFLDRYHKGKLNNHGDAAAILRLGLLIANGQSNDGRWGYNLPGGAVDNSNTQFCVVALWIAKKYCKPKSNQLRIITQALYNTEKKMRASQTQEGGWTYDPSNVQVGAKTTGSMTCAGILGIALSSGLRAEQQLASFRGAGGADDGGDVVKFLDQDPAIAAAKLYLSQAISTFNNPAAVQEGHITYFLWSLERVATLYKWKNKNFNNVDWFEIGARYLMSKQQRNGSWNLDFLSGATIDTAFSLLFLAKSNLLGDLQQAVFEQGKIVPDVVPKKKDAPKTETAKDKAKDLLEKLLTALPDQQTGILADLTEGKGSEYSEALVEAIQKLSSNAAKESAREALANRFRRLKNESIVANLNHDNREVKIAAITAARFKNETANAAALIPVLQDQDPGVSAAAYEALKSLSGQDFGKSINGWSRWLDNINKKKP